MNCAAIGGENNPFYPGNSCCYGLNNEGFAYGNFYYGDNFVGTGEEWNDGTSFATFGSAYSYCNVCAATAASNCWYEGAAIV